MTLTRLRENQTENRTYGGASYPMGAYGLTDPSAIPPPGLTFVQRAGVLVTESTMLQVDVIFTALRILSNTVIRLGNMRAYREELSPDNMPYKVWQPTQPPILVDSWGGKYRQYDGRSRTVWSMGLFGEAFWYVLERSKQRGNLAEPTALDILHPAFMEVTAKPDGSPIYIYGTGQNKKELDPGNVIHIPNKALPQSLRAMAPIKYAAVASALAMAAYEFGSTWFSQGASPDFILSTDQKLGQEEITRLASKFVIEHGGLNASHLPLVLDRGLKADKVMSSPDDSQYLQTLEYARSVIGSWFGMPAEWLGNALQRLTPAPPGSLEDETMRYAQNTLSGYVIPLEECTSTLINDPEVFAGFDESRLSKPNAAMIAAEVGALRQFQVATPNDLRTRLLRWPPIEGGDALVTPLASNTSPAQTDNPMSGDSPSPDSEPAASGDNKTA